MKKTPEEFVLTEQRVVEILREEYNRKISKSLSSLLEKSVEEDEEDEEEKPPKEPKFNNKKIGPGKIVLSVGTSVKHIETGLVYKILAVSPNGVVLDPGREKVDAKTLEDEYLIK